MGALTGHGALPDPSYAIGREMQERDAEIGTDAGHGGEGGVDPVGQRLVVFGAICRSIGRGGCDNARATGVNRGALVSGAPRSAMSRPKSVT